MKRRRKSRTAAPSLSPDEKKFRAVIRSRTIDPVIKAWVLQTVRSAFSGLRT